MDKPGSRAARRRSQSALPRETYYLRSRWSLARGMRRLDAALSNDLLNICDTAENHSGSRTKSAKEFSRKVREEMEGGNEVNNVSVVTLCLNRAYQNDEAENLHGWRPPSGVEEISRKVRKVRKVLNDASACGGSLQKSKNAESHSDPLVRGHSVRRSLFAPPKNLFRSRKPSGSRTKSANESLKLSTQSSQSFN